jgi:hypothetical protein
MGSATHRMSVDAFDPEITHTMGDAFDWAWDELSDCGHEATLPSKSSRNARPNGQANSQLG